MHCSGCGKDVPFGGQVCPFCQRDKSSDQALTLVVSAALIAGAFVGNLIGGFGGAVAGGVLCGLVAAIVGQAGKGHSAKKPPIVRVDRPRLSTDPKPKPSAAPSAEERLRRLDDLRSKGLITDDEHQARRTAIIDAL